MEFIKMESYLVDSRCVSWEELTAGAWDDSGEEGGFREDKLQFDLGCYDRQGPEEAYLATHEPAAPDVSYEIDGRKLNEVVRQTVTARQYEVLWRSLLGSTQGLIGLKMGISQSSVRDHLAGAEKKLRKRLGNNEGLLGRLRTAITTLPGLTFSFA